MSRGEYSGTDRRRGAGIIAAIEAAKQGVPADESNQFTQTNPRGGNEYLTGDNTAVFTIYKGTTKVEGTDILGLTTTSFESGVSGVFHSGILNYGTYYLHETIYPDGVTQNGAEGWWYYLIVDESGVYMSKQYANRDDSATGATERSAKIKEEKQKHVNP